MKIKQMGFSLLEILVVIVIASSLVSIGIGNWQSYQQQLHIDDTSAQVMALLSRIQVAANWRNKAYRLNLSFKQNTWCLSSEEDPQLSHCIPQQHIEMVDYNQSSPIVFYGKRNMAAAGHLTVENSVARVRIIVSTRGRIRRCTEYGYQLTGVPQC